MKKVFLNLLGLMMISHFAPSVYALEVTTDKPAYLRYELVEIIASLGQSETAEAFPRKLMATVWREDEQIISAGNFKYVPLHFRPDQSWHGYWPIPFNPALGDYRVEIMTVQADGNSTTVEASFTLEGKNAYQLPAGFSVVTDEGGKKGPWVTPGFTPDEPLGLVNMVRWATFMGADAFWECIGQTQVWGKFYTNNFPWPADIHWLIKRVGKAAHDAGLKYGAWIVAFVALGDRLETTGYEFTKGYDRQNGTLHTTRYISLGCKKRLNDIAELMKKLEAAPEVDYIGFDYMRTDWGGYEFASDFVRDMSINAPPEWSGWSEEERSLWMAKLIEVTRNPVARARWEWWRAHKVALVVTQLLEEVKPTKPLWIFSLGWMTGHQHGQDVVMMRDAGIGFNAPMFYHLDKAQVQEMMNSWKDYMEQAKPSIVVGQCVDWNLLGKANGPAEHLDRQMQALKKLMPVSDSFGFFWHDASRSHYGARGPYGTLEWVMAGAVSFSRLKAAAGRISYQLELKAPQAMKVSQMINVCVEITNTTANTLTAVAVELLSDAKTPGLPRLESPDPGPKIIQNLLPGRHDSVSFKCRTNQIFARNGGQQMIAVKATCPEDGPHAPRFEFIYLPVLSEEPVAVGAGNSHTSQGEKGP